MSLFLPKLQFSCYCCDRSNLHPLTSGAEEFIKRLGGKTWSEVKFQDTIAELTSLEFLELTVNNRYEMHISHALHSMRYIFLYVKEYKGTMNPLNLVSSLCLSRG